MRFVPCLLIAAGAFASIATSKAPPAWTLSQEQDLTAAVIDTTTPAARYHVHVELHGPEPFVGLEGTLEAEIAVTARTTSSATATIEIDSLTHPDVMPAKTSAGLNSTMTNYLATDILLACESDPCVEDYELVVEPETTDVPTIDVTGNVVVLASGEQGPMPAGTALDITVAQQ